MNRQRLRTVRDQIGKLNTAPSFSGHAKVTCETQLTVYPEHASPIDTLDMNTYHSRFSMPGDCRTLGCIAGITVCLYPEEAREIRARTNEETELLRPGIGEMAQEILELTDDEAWALFHSQPKERGQSPITPEQATTAIDRLIAGEDPENIWNGKRAS